MHTYCCDFTRATNEPLIGSASRNDFHLVLSIPKGQWTAKVEQMEGIAGQLAQLTQPLKDQAQLSLKDGTPEERGTIWLFPHGYCFGQLDSMLYPELVAQAQNGQISLPYTTLPDKIILLCTHGKRDAACAKFGGAVLTTLKAQPMEGVQVWEVTHLGGHRFAGTAVVQPYHHWYGLLTPKDVPDFLESVQSGVPLLRHYRGNAHYPQPLQVAEAWGWTQLEQLQSTGDVHLFNPTIIDETLAEVTVGVESGTGLYKTRLTLVAQHYKFLADSNSDKMSSRMIWQIVKAVQL